jgi:hypothetical protein
MEKPQIKIERYIGNRQYSCIILGVFPTEQRQKTKEGQRLIVHENVIGDYDIVNPDMLELEILQRVDLSDDAFKKVWLTKICQSRRQTEDGVQTTGTGQNEMTSELFIVVGSKTCFTGTFHSRMTVEGLKEADKDRLTQMAKELGDKDCVVAEVDDTTTTLCYNGQIVAIFRRRP